LILTTSMHLLAIVESTKRRITTKFDAIISKGKQKQKQKNHPSTNRIVNKTSYQSTHNQINTTVKITELITK
jgi:hypothetical protein